MEVHGGRIRVENEHITGHLSLFMIVELNFSRPPGMGEIAKNTLTAAHSMY